jgi:signal transduction histidine kinase
VVTLAREGETGSLAVEDDGTGIPEVPTNHQGLGLRIMSYRANMLGGSLEVQRGSKQGTLIRCRFPLAS